MSYRKHFILLESNPTVFTELAHGLHLSPELEFHNVFSLDEPDLLSLIPRPALALVLREYSKSGVDEDVVWFKQTINNACGLYGILHAVVTNGAARDFIVPKSHLASLLTSVEPLRYLDRAAVLEEDEQPESIYKTIALQGDTEVPENAEDEVDFHYVCFAKSHKNGHLYELDGDRKGLIERGALDQDDDVLSERALGVILEFIRGVGKDISFSLLALAPAVN
ncbi:Ubiquitin carboxyl-terminal hydrolase [Fusarium sp. Ph1]|nr:Ubiquitin carboxyl-terminal hydrolase [Fusarium sp. Ph1]